MHLSQPSITTSSPISTNVWERTEQGQSFRVRHIAWPDTDRQRAYQALRRAIFVDRLHWKVALTADGLERDRSDEQQAETVHVFGVYGLDGTQEHLLAGIRVFRQETWETSMLAQEFVAAGMLSAHGIQTLHERYPACQVLDLTRFCVQRGHSYRPLDSTRPFTLSLARDLTYAAVYWLAEQTNRPIAIALVSPAYLRTLAQGHFAVAILHTHRLHDPLGCALISIDLSATIQALHATHQHVRAERMLTLCTPQHVLQENGALEGKP